MHRTSTRKMGRFGQILGNTFLVQQLYGSKYAPHIGKFHIPYAYVKAMLFAASADELSPPERRYIEGLVEILLPASDAQMIENRVEIVQFIEAVPTATTTTTTPSNTNGVEPQPQQSVSFHHGVNSTLQQQGNEQQPGLSEATVPSSTAATAGSDPPFTYIGIEDDDAMLPPSFYAAYKASHPWLITDCPPKQQQQQLLAEQRSAAAQRMLTQQQQEQQQQQQKNNAANNNVSPSTGNNSNGVVTTSGSPSEATNDKNISTFLSGSMLTSPVLSRVLLYDAIRAASADGIFSSEERDHVRRVSKQLGISENVRVKLENISERETELVRRKKELLSRI